MIPAVADRYAVLNLRLAGPQVFVRLGCIKLEMRSVHLVKDGDEGKKYYTETAWPLLIFRNADSPVSRNETPNGPIFVGESRTVLLATPPEFRGDLKGTLYFALHPHGQRMSGRWVGMSYDGKIVSGWGAMARDADEATSAIEDLKRQEHGLQRADV